MQKLDLVATVKFSTDQEDHTECNVFLLSNENMVGKTLYQVRDEVQCGTWEVLDQGKGVLKLKRMSGEAEFVMVDALYTEHVEPVVVSEPVRAPQKVMTFSGKNWKLASEKKWKEIYFHFLDEAIATAYKSGASESVGEATIRGSLYTIHKFESTFLAVPKTV